MKEAKEKGTFDDRVQCLAASSVRITDRRLIHVDKATGELCADQNSSFLWVA